MHKHTVLESIVDGLQQGWAYTFALLAMSLIQTVIRYWWVIFLKSIYNNVVFAFRIIPEGFEIPMFTEQFGAFITFACLAAGVAATRTILQSQRRKGAAK